MSKDESYASTSQTRSTPRWLFGLVAAALLLTVALVAASFTRARGEHSLAAAARAGDLDQLRVLLDRGVDVNSRTCPGKGPSCGLTPLLWAVMNGRINAAQLLLERGANPNARTPEGMSVFHYLMAGLTADVRDPMLELLLEAGADPRIEEGNPHSPLMFRPERGDTAAVELLVRHGLDPFVADGGVEWGSMVERILKTGDEALIAALWRGMSEAQRRDRRAEALASRVAELGLRLPRG